MSLHQLSSTLWRERELLGRLVVALEADRLLPAGHRRAAGRDVEGLLEEVGRAELDRALNAEDAAEALRLGAGPTLRQLAAAAPVPWDAVLRDHRSALTASARRAGAERLQPSLADFLR